MRHFIPLTIAFIAPQLSHAQLIKKVEIGTYVLNATPQVRQQAGLYLRNSEQLVVRNLAGENKSFSPQEIRSFQIGNRQFITTGGFRVNGGFGERYITQAFAEQVDSGQVLLLRYQVPPSTAANRGNIGFDTEAGQSIFLLRAANTNTVTPIQAGWSKKTPAFQEALRPYLAARPDLLRLLTEKVLAPKQLPLIIHALNNNLPYGATSGQAASK